MMKILFFLESLHGGGKERRSAELINYLNRSSGDYRIEIVLTEAEIHYDDILNDKVRIHILKRRGMKYDPALFLGFYRICRRFDPDIIHCWGKMTTFYAIPSRILLKKPLISSLIADSKRGYGKLSPYYLLFKTNVGFSDVVLSNSAAGLKAYQLEIAKARVIHNGVSMNRFMTSFDHESVRRKFGITTRFLVVMVAGFSKFKDYDLFVEVAKKTGMMRNDVSFMAVGDGDDWIRINNRIVQEGIGNVILAGRQKEVEPIIAASDIGILCTKSEGISNSIIEYMALGKPVIATDLTGGTRELIIDEVTGYCTDRDVSHIVGLISRLLDDELLRNAMGRNGMERIRNNFSIDIMGEKFRDLYHETSQRISAKSKPTVKNSFK